MYESDAAQQRHLRMIHFCVTSTQRSSNRITKTTIPTMWDNKIGAYRDTYEIEESECNKLKLVYIQHKRRESEPQAQRK